MKTSLLSVAVLAATFAPVFAGTPSISVSASVAGGDAINIASIRAEDAVVRDEIIEMYKEAKKAFPENHRNLFGPDSGYVSIQLTDGDETLVIRSWHPLFAKNRKLVVTSHGVESLNGRNPEDVLKEDEAWYQEARTVFDKIVNYAKDKGGKDHEGIENSSGSTESRDPGSASSGVKIPSRLAFTEEKEFTLSAIDGELPSQCLNLRTMEVIMPPAGLKDWPDEELKQWMTQNPETLMLSQGRGKGWELIHFTKPKTGTRLIKIDEKIWEEKSIAMKDLRGLMNHSAVTPAAWGFINSPDIFLFRSYAGVTYLLRVAEFADNAGSVKIILRIPRRERKAERVPGKENTGKTPSPDLFNFDGFFPSWKETTQQTPSTELERARAELAQARKLADTNVISRTELLQVEEKEALLRAKEEGSPISEISMAAIRVRFARERLKMKQGYFDAGLIPRAELDIAQSDLKNAEAEFGQTLNQP